jgi:hypothetical protein
MDRYAIRGENAVPFLTDDMESHGWKKELDNRCCSIYQVFSG